MGILYIGAYSTGCEWLIFVAMVLAALDARRVQIWRYDSEIAWKPGTLFLLMLVLGWLILPWYVALRLRIVAGEAPLKDEYQWIDRPPPGRGESAPPPGLIKPWSPSWRRRFGRSAHRRPRR